MKMQKDGKSWRDGERCGMLTSGHGETAALPAAVTTHTRFLQKCANQQSVTVGERFLGSFLSVLMQVMVVGGGRDVLFSGAATGKVPISCNQPHRNSKLAGYKEDMKEEVGRARRERRRGLRGRGRGREDKGCDQNTLKTCMKATQ